MRSPDVPGSGQPVRVRNRFLVGVVERGVKASRIGVIGVVGVLVVAGCSGHPGRNGSVATTLPTSAASTLRPTTTTSVATQRFVAATDFGLTFDHPRVWSESRYRNSSSFSDLIVYVSNTKLHDPCTTTHVAGEVTTICGDPVTRLASGGVLVSWSNIGYPHTGPEIPHPNMTIDGRPAHVSVSEPGDCARLGAQETMTVDIARPIGNHYEMVACLRAPGVTRDEALIRQMLTSVRISG